MKGNLICIKEQQTDAARLDEEIKKNLTGLGGIVRQIHAVAKTVRALLKGVKYSVDYYQREYKWQEKQIRELVDDLTVRFLDDYQEGHRRPAGAAENNPPGNAKLRAQVERRRP